MTTVNLNAIATATATVRKDAARICELCTEAGQPSRAGGFIARGVKPHIVARQLRGTVVTNVGLGGGGVSKRTDAFADIPVRDQWSRPAGRNSTVSASSGSFAEGGIASRLDGAAVI
jgi:hypothetical protein